MTIPYKRKVMQYCRTISDTAKAADSVNTIVKQPDGSLAGYNTDYDGFRYTVEKSGVSIDRAKCLIFGSGGVSGTVKKVLEDLGAAEIRIISRTGPDNYENLDRHGDAEILVNATPVGMYPNLDASPVDVGRFPHCRGAFDLIYNPLRTRFLLDAEAKGIPTFNGLDMLVAQAAYACRLFTGEDPRDKIGEVSGKIQRDQENIVLIGMPGSGKTTVGKELAKLTGKVFRDTDEAIRSMYGKSPEEIILSEGEPAFRQRESEVIRNIAGEGGQVIATGGGAVLREENKNQLRSNGRIVYIKRDLEELPETGRPVSQSAGVKVLFEERREKYESWQDLTVENRNVTETAEEIRVKLGY